MRPRPEVPHRANCLGGYAPHPSPHLPDSSWCRMKRRNSTGFSRIPSRLAHRARPIRQYWTDATLSRLLPPSPAIPGSGYLQLHPIATTMRRWRSFTPIRDTRASWRTINFCRLRTFFRSPACDAAKIRCRSRRTSFSAVRQATAPQSKPRPSGPFTASQPSPTRAVSGEVSSSVVVASNVPLRFQRRRSPESSQAHLTRVSTLSGQGISLYPASYAGIASGGASL